MSVETILDKDKKIQKEFLEYIDAQENIEENYQNFMKIFDEIKIRDDPFELKLFLYMLTAIINNHNRDLNFFSKIEKILSSIKNDIKKYFTNHQIFDIFKRNKRILLYLFEEKIITFDQYIFNTITNDKYVWKRYPEYFTPEIKPFITEEMIQKNEEKKKNYTKYHNNWIDNVLGILPENFEEKRKIGENDDHFLELIRKDDIDQFIIYVNKNNESLDKLIVRSIFETNKMLLKSKLITLIDYAAFFGSVQIFKYLIINGVKLTNSLWIYAIHGRNPELINLIEEKSVVENSKEYNNYIIESIKCHHNEIANYIEINYLQNQKTDFTEKALEYYNFALMEYDSINQSTFCDLCKYDYYNLVEFMIKNMLIDVNHVQIFKLSFDEIFDLYNIQNVSN